MFGFLQIGLLIITQAHTFIQNAFQGLIWFLLPVLLVIVNDIFSYIFGFFYGKTQLISLSPKKTWEGFIGGAISTIIIGFILTAIMVQFKTLVCPLEFDKELFLRADMCEPGPIFRPQEYHMPFKMYLYPIQLHSLVFSIFASLISPFGGFFASGFLFLFCFYAVNLIYF